MKFTRKKKCHALRCKNRFMEETKKHENRMKNERYLKLMADGWQKRRETKTFKFLNEKHYLSALINKNCESAYPRHLPPVGL